MTRPTCAPPWPFLSEHGAHGRDALPAVTDAKLRDAHNYYAAIRHHREVCGAAECDADNVVAWLRYWHAFLTAHRREMSPGQLKAFPNSVIVNPDVERTAPGLVEGTLAHVCARTPVPRSRGVPRAPLWFTTSLPTCTPSRTATGGSAAS